ncbi:MAG: hypothetical protein ACFCUS_11585 [Rubrimonas sp.]|uniref:hypothetical protein n=1 Tax=Rubrimonas sp. TaxID=2036015 RepID=UPI002FDDF548
MARRNDDIPDSDAAAARRRRLTEALRDNLRRRKAQARARGAAEPSDDLPDPAPDESGPDR